MKDETTKPSWDEYQDISKTLKQLLSKGYTEPMIKTVLEQLRLEQQQRWIPVSKRLPKTRDEVLIFLANGQMTIASYNDHFLPFFNKPIGWGVDTKRFVFDFCSDDVIAWMPLPEPYKAESEEEALEQQTSEDCISRQKALDCFEQTNTRQGAKHAIETLSSVTPQRPEGRWIATENEEMNIDGYYCSCCDLPMETEERTEYCPNCGAKMKAESEG